jgi:pyruvate/2-oxoglutarate dehydrogenase complex dihydrolipoamide dehydrogenase (E3) component
MEYCMSQHLELLPDSPADRTLLQRVAPADWKNPQPAGRYNLVVIGAGTAGLVAAAGAAGLGAKVALIERELLGGDCLNVGCVPSKAIIRSARAAAELRGAARFGVQVSAGIGIDFARVMERMRILRAGLAVNDSVDRFRSLGVDVFPGEARFTGPDAVEVAGTRLRFARAVIATGTRPTRPAIPALAEAGFLTNESIFNLTALPRRLAVVGGGPIGCELAQAFARFGSEVTVIDTEGSILPREELEASKVVNAALRRDGVMLELGRPVARVAREAGGKVLFFADDKSLTADEILVAVGRTPNTDGLNLDAAGIRYGTQGVEVDDFLQTSNRRVFAAGDICSRFKFTHAADAMARIVVQNALFFGRARVSALTIPWCTYTDPELARVGLTEEEASARGIAIDTFIQEMKHVDRAVLDGDDEGFLKVHVRKRTDRIVGATAVAVTAAAMISELTLAMTAGVGLKTLARTIHPYPTQTEAVRKIADAYNRTRLTPFAKGVLTRILAWRR